MYLFSLIKSGAVHLHKKQKILPESEYIELKSIEALLLTAQQDVQDLKDQAEKDAEIIKKQAFDAGFQEGLKQFHEKLLFLDEESKRLKIEATQKILPLVLKAAKKVVGEELKTHPEAIVSIVQQIIKPVLTHHKVKLRLSKTDKEFIEKEKPAIKALFEKLELFLIEEDADLTPGSCIIETENGIINASLENQWRALEAAFLAFHPNSRLDQEN